MAAPPTESLTRLLNRLGEDDPQLQGELISRLYGELRLLASSRLRSPAGRQTLQTTALVHEAWIKLRGAQELRFEGRKQFFMLASQVMRAVVIDHERARRAAKRTAPEPAVEPEPMRTTDGLDLLALEEALARLESVDPQLARIVEMRFFAGLAHREIGEILDVPLRTVERRWQLARAWLKDALDEDGSDSASPRGA